MRDYGDEEIQKFRHFSIYMTANPTVTRPFIEDIYCWGYYFPEEGFFTYDNLMEAAMTVSATRGLPYALGLELKQLTEIGLDIVDVILWIKGVVLWKKILVITDTDIHIYTIDAKDLGILDLYRKDSFSWDVLCESLSINFPEIWLS